MDIQIICIFGENDVPRHAIGKISADSYAVLSPFNEGDNTLEFNLNDIIEIREPFPGGPGDFLNKTTGKTISAGVCKIGINADQIRKEFYPMFK